VEVQAVLDVRAYEACERLKDAQSVYVRAIRPDDKETILAGMSQFSEASVYKRFHGPKQGFTEQELRFMTEIDYLYHVALVVALKENGQVIGGGRYICYDESLPPRRAEVAFAVVDSFQGLGVGSIVLKHLIIIAREVGVGKFEAEVLVENSAMMRVFEKSGPAMTKDYERRNVHITMTL
jgi:RimJ/RimL family protein N-acetyltransferase